MTSTPSLLPSQIIIIEGSLADYDDDDPNNESPYEYSLRRIQFLV
jgi:hypothetical protein